MTHLALQVDVREVFPRSPQEIREQLEQARCSVGTLIPVTGGNVLWMGAVPRNSPVLAAQRKRLILRNGIRWSICTSRGRRNWRTANKRAWSWRAAVEALQREKARISAEWEQRFLAHQDDTLSWRLRAEAVEKRL